MRGRNQEHRCEESQEGRRERTAAKPLGQSERSDDRGDRREEKCAVHCNLAEPHERSDSGDVIGAERRILHRDPHWLGEGRPVDDASVRIKRLPHDLLTHPEKQRIIDVVGLVKKRQ